MIFYFWRVGRIPRHVPRPIEVLPENLARELWHYTVRLAVVIVVIMVLSRCTAHSRIIQKTRTDGFDTRVGTVRNGQSVGLPLSGARGRRRKRFREATGFVSRKTRVHNLTARSRRGDIIVHTCDHFTA